MSFNIEVHAYTSSGSIDATIDGQRRDIPNDPTNRHRQMIAEWEAEGNTIPAYVPPPEPSPLDETLGRIQYEFMIEKLGIKAAIEAAISSLPESTEAEQNAKIMAGVLHRSGTEFYRSHPLFTELAPAVGLTTQQIDDAWTQATQLTW